MNKCNHTLGYNCYGDSETKIVTVYSFLREQTLPLVEFTYCPDCGVQLDWEKIDYETLSKEYPELLK